MSSVPASEHEFDHDVAAAQARECLAGAGFPVRLAEADLLRFLDDCADKSPLTGVTARDFPQTVAVVLDMARTSGFQPAALELFRDQRGFHRLFCFQPASAVTPREHSP